MLALTVGFFVGLITGFICADGLYVYFAWATATGLKGQHRSSAMGKITAAEVRNILNARGVHISRTLWEDWRVWIPLPAGPGRIKREEASAYYTDDLEDAMMTGLAMAKERDMREALHG